MIRIRLRAPSNDKAFFISRDLIHDGAVNMLIAAGATKDAIIGRDAANWSASPVFVKKDQSFKDLYFTSEIIISTTDPIITKFLLDAKMTDFKASKAYPDEKIALSDWSAEVEASPVVGDDVSLKVICASPVVFTKRDSVKKQSVLNPHDIDVSAAVNARLSRLSGRLVDLKIVPDQAYLSHRQNPSVRTVFKAGSRPAIVHGMMFPMTISGSSEDVELAWYSGLGEKTRLGYGTICAANRGV